MNNLIYKLKKSDFADKITLIVAMVLLVVLFGALNRNYVTGANMINILIACSLTGFVAIGETNLIIANQNDLSAGSVAACAGVLAAILAREGVPAILALAIAVCAGFLVGAVNAGLVTFLKLQPFIATLATMSVVRGIAYILCNGKAVAISDKTFIKFGNYRIFGILPVPVLLLLIAFIVFSIILSKTYFGRSIYVLGGNTYAARLAGLNPTRIIFKLHIIESGLAAFAGVLLADTAVKAATVDVVGYSSPANGGTSFSNEVILTFTGDSGAVKQAIIAARDVGMQVLKTLEPSVELKSTTTPYIL